MKSETIYLQRPRIEGCHINSWLGFKHLVFIIEESIYDFFRQNNYSQRKLIIDYGLKLKVYYSKIDIISVVNSDDLLSVHVQKEKYNNEFSFVIKAVFQDGKVAFKGKAKAVIEQTYHTDNIPEELLSYIDQRNLLYNFENIELFNNNCLNVIENQYQDKNHIVWRKKIKYFHCYYRYELAHTAYIKAVEEIEDVFLSERNISISKMLKTRDWIPFVSSSNIEIRENAFLDEELIMVFSISRIFKECLYEADIDFYVERDNILINVAKGRITHGYTYIENTNKWSMVNFDNETIKALSNG